MKLSKKLLAILLAMIMLASLFCVSCSKGNADYDAAREEEALVEQEIQQLTKRVAWLERVVAQLNNRIVKLEKK